MELTGILMKKIGERTGVSPRNGNAWKMAEFLIEVPGQYPRHTVFQVSDGQQSRITRFESLIGKTVTVSFDLDAHEYQGRWFNEIKAWGIMEYVAGRKLPETKVAEAATDQKPEDKSKPEPAEEQKADDGLPF